MKQFEFEPIWLSFPGRAIQFPAVYTPNTQFHHARFMIAADVSALHKPTPDVLDFLEYFIHPERNTIKASSSARPEVVCGDVPALVAALQNLDARNLNRDRLFTKCPIVSFGVSPYRYDIQGRSGYTLYFHKVQISLPKELP